MMDDQLSGQPAAKWLSPGSSGRWMRLGRIGWVAFALLTLALFVRGVPIALQELAIPCTASPCSTDGPYLLQTQSPSAAALRAFAAYNVTWDGILLSVLIALSVNLLRRRADQRIALAAAFMLVGFSGASFSDTLTAANLLGGVWWWLVAIVGVIGSTSIFPFLYMLPDGRFVPGWTRWTSVAWAVVCVMGYVAPPTPALSAAGTNSFAFPLMALGFFVTTVVAQVHRYRIHASPSQRQQIKWVVGGAFAAIGLLILNLLVFTAIATNAGGLTINYIGDTVIHVALLMLPAAIVIAIVKTHLWDIDRIINRALVYGGLSACLIAVYVGAVLVFQRLFNPLTGESDLTIAISTLLVAALFNPVRHRIQAIVDRRFYRQRYDAERALTSFGAAARDEVDLERLAGALTNIIAETVQPEHLSVWLRDVGASQ